MRTPRYTSRPASGLGLTSQMTADRAVTKAKSAKPARNRNRVTSAKPGAVANRKEKPA
jgi:hypothetical protein